MLAGVIGPGHCGFVNPHFSRGKVPKVKEEDKKIH